MAILGSRNQYCIHPTISSSKFIQSDCNTLLKTIKGCSYNHSVGVLKNDHRIQPGGVNQIWDIEDLRILGKGDRACPYFTSKLLAKEADIVFCPYNYLFDPVIRRSMGINLKNSVVIVDEAHNIESVCRSSVSHSFTLDELRQCEHEVRTYVEKNIYVEIFSQLLPLLEGLLQFLEKAIVTLKSNGFERKTNVWDGNQFVAILEGIGLTVHNLDNYFARYVEIIAIDTKEPQPLLSATSNTLLESNKKKSSFSLLLLLIYLIFL